MPARSHRTVHLETFGCQMNELDSELARGQLLALGYRFTDDPARADILLYNTCSVRDHAEQKVRSRLGELRPRKEREPGLVVGVLGCMAERDGADLLRRMPVVDVLCGPGELDRLPTLIDNAVRTRSAMIEAGSWLDGSGRPVSAKEVALQGNTARRAGVLAAAEDNLELLDLSRAISPNDHDGSAYVRITRGCNKFCTYCVVPHTRGPEVHRPPEHIVDECRRLADAGVVEVTLLGQTVNHYRYEHGAMVAVNGLARPQKGRSYPAGRRRDPFRGERVTTFADLLRRIHDEVPAIRRLRFVTSFPRDFGDDVLEVMRDCPRICRYLHVPAQSGSNRILKAMNRGYTVEEYLEFLDRARSFLDEPDKARPVMIAGDVIAGFCGETDEDHRATIDLLRRARYKNCFVFKYSPRPGTAAFDRLPDDVPEEVKRRRVNELLTVQHGISEEVGREQVGRVFDVLVQGVSPRERKRLRKWASGGVALTVAGRPADSAAGEARSEPPGEPAEMTGRTEGDLIVAFECPSGVKPADLVGKVVPVRIESAASVTLFGRLAGFVPSAGAD